MWEQGQREVSRHKTVPDGSDPATPLAWSSVTPIILAVHQSRWSLRVKGSMGKGLP